MTLVLSVLSLPTEAKPRKLKPVPEKDIAKMKEAIPDKPTVTPQKKRKLLIFCLCDGFFHGSIPWANKCFELIGEKTGAYSSVVSQDINIFDKDKLKEFDAILFNNTTRLKFKSKEQVGALMDFVKGGKGVIAVHGAADNFYKEKEAAAMVGGLFDGHPWTANGKWAFKLDEKDHPLNKAFGGEGFKVKDEIYQFKGPYSRDTHRVLVSLDLSDDRTAKRRGKRKDKDYAVVWIKKCGQGRVFHSGFGHNNHIFWHKEIVKQFLDGIQYALGDYKMSDEPSGKK
jgi:type 1 glutamine amidotransferase